MPTGYVKKLGKKHGVSSATAEKHWETAKAAAQKEGHGEDYGYVTSIFKNMMHEHAFIPSLKDLTNGMTFKYFLVAEADGAEPQQMRSPAYKHLSDRFPQFNELPFKTRRELEKEVQSEDLLGDYDSLPQEEKDSVDEYLHDLVIDKMQAEVGQGHNFRDWQKDDEDYRARQAAHDAEQADVDDASAALRGGDEEGPQDRYSDMAARAEKPKRRSSGPRHLAAMRTNHIPTDKAAFAPAGSDEVGAPVKSYYKKWGDLQPEQRAARSAMAKKHGTMYYVRSQPWFKSLPPEKQEAVVNAVKGGASRAQARQAGM